MMDLIADDEVLSSQQQEKEDNYTIEQPRKKQKTIESHCQRKLQHDEDWQLTITSPHAFKSMCDIISNVLIHSHFHVVDNKEFSGIRIDSVDPSMVCMVKAKFSCVVQKKYF